MASLSTILGTLRAKAHNPTTASAIAQAIPEDATADVVIGTAVDRLIDEALAAHPAVKATEAEKRLAKCSANARSLALAILAVASGRPADVRAISGWKDILACEDRAALARTVEATSKALADCIGGDVFGADAYKRGSNGLLGKGKLKAPTSAQAAARLLRDAWLASNGTAAMATPAASARKLAAQAKAMPVADKARKAA